MDRRKLFQQYTWDRGLCYWLFGLIAQKVTLTMFNIWYCGELSCKNFVNICSQ